jgi:gas vesicle protein
VAASLDQPQNFWGLKKLPEDWLPWLETSNVEEWPTAKRGGGDDHLQATIAQLLQPLQAEIVELKQKLASGPPKRSNFEISLTQIPPEVEEKLWVRLREDLGAQVLKQTREQSEEVLAGTKEAIGKKLREAHNEFHADLTRELQSVESKAQILAEEINDTVQQHTNLRLEKFQQQVFEAGVHLETRSEEFLRALQQRLAEDHDLYRREVQKVQAEHAADSARLQMRIGDLESRVARMDEAARRLESEMEAHLEKVAGNIISSARSQLESAVEVVVKELGKRNAKELDGQLHQACDRLRETHKQMETSVKDLLKTEVSGRLLSFGQTMEELAQDSVGRWRMALSRDLSSLANTLGQQFRVEDTVRANGK